jgi:hypothetical protein
MKKEFIIYEFAIRLKALGYDEPCYTWYDSVGNFNYKIDTKFGVNYNSNSAKHQGIVSAPTWKQAFSWFRDKFEDIQFEIVPSHWNHKYTGFYHITAGFLNLETMEMSYSVGAGGFETYDEAELACLEKLIEIVEQAQ